MMRARREGMLERNGIREGPVLDDMTDKQAQFEALVRSYSADLYRMAVWLCRDPALADDLTQETFLRAWKSIGQLRDGKAAKGWLITILRREFARLFERKTPGFVDAEDVVLPDLAGPDPVERTEARLLRKAIAELDGKYREPLVLQVLGGLSCREIADELGITRSAVMTQLFRARQQLKDRLGVEDDHARANDLS